MEQLPPKAREQIAQKMLKENKGRIATSATPPAAEQRKVQRQTSPEDARPRNDSGNGEAKSKYGNKKAVRVLANGKEFKFDSQKEARRFDELLVLLQAGQIKDLKLQPEFTLREAYTDPEGWHVRPLKYRADFSYMERVTPVRGGQGSGRPTGAEDSWGFCAEQWRYVVEDVKSYATKTRVYEMKKQLMLEKFKIRIREV